MIIACIWWKHKLEFLFSLLCCFFIWKYGSCWQLCVWMCLRERERMGKIRLKTATVWRGSSIGWANWQQKLIHWTVDAGLNCRLKRHINASVWPSLSLLIHPAINKYTYLYIVSQHAIIITERKKRKNKFPFMCSDWLS